MLNVYALGMLRLIACCIFAAGAIWLASLGKEGWGWCIFAAILISDFSIKRNSK